MDEDTEQRTGRPRRPWSVRVRVVAAMTAVMTLGLVAAGAVTFSVTFAELNQRVRSELLQEVDELSSLAARGPQDGDPGPYTDLDELFQAYLLTSVPGDHESMVSLVDGVPTLVPGGDLPFHLDSPEVVAAARAAFREGETVITNITDDGRDLKMVVADVQLPGETRQGAFVVAIDVGAQRRAVWNNVGTYSLVALATVLLTALLGHLIAGRLLRPITDLRQATAGISSDDLTRRVEVTGADNDIAQLALTFNQMLDRLETGFADQRQFLDDAAHELRTPLTIIQGNLELMDSGDVADVGQTRELVLDELARMKRLVDDLLLLAKSQRPDFVRPQAFDVAVFAEELKDRVHMLGDRHWEAWGGATGEVVADRQRLQQAVVQLAANAVKFSDRQDTIEVGLDWSPPTAEVREAVPEAAERYLVVTVRDTGVGIDPDQVDRIFERFGRGADAHGVEGAGLGLAIVLAIARAHHGTVTLDSLPGRGSTFRLWIPDSGMLEPWPPS
ncbi:sensor histidine kinase [Ornithinicoccus hortensis]|uniref:histidine kinase n=1 Tax=Ornithinicoccus hortensis TaxID=82346 RepID=A0A542YMK9_9MICO|nr:HAMP domain-containing sensor histidine kinase [Ornithinicoccus hortensis]TQL49194.1 signal transduction histidine kinase [Ornithinicoccus hortensis]